MERGKLRRCLETYAAACAFLLLFELVYAAASRNDVDHDYVSAIGDPGMRRDGLRVAIESWNQCNEVGIEAPNMGSPRMADCFNVKYRGRSQSKCPF